MSENFSVSVPWTKKAIMRLRNMLNGFIDDFNETDEPVTDQETTAAPAPPANQETTAAPAPPANQETTAAPAPPANQETTAAPAPPADQGTPAPPADQGTPAPPADQGNIELDADGIPWDSRIHAETKTKNKDNTWRVKRGIDKDLVATVKTELKARFGPTATPAAPPANQETTAPAPPADQNKTAAPAPGKDFTYLVTQIAQRGIKPEVVNPVLQKYNFTVLPEVMNRPDLVESICNELGI